MAKIGQSLRERGWQEGRLGRPCIIIKGHQYMNCEKAWGEDATLVADTIAARR